MLVSGARLIDVQVQGGEDIKRFLKERLLSGWVVVTGDLHCVEEFKRRYYGESSEDFVSRGIIYYAKDSSGRLYPDITVISLARKRRELEGVLGDVERALRLHFESVSGECKAKVKYASRILSKLSIEMAVREVLRDVKAMGLRKATSQKLAERDLRYEGDIKKVLRERLLSGWILVTGDPGCIEDFKRRYYGEGSTDFEEHAIVVSVKGEKGLHVDIFTIPLARKKRELEELVRDLERAVNIEFKRVGNECEAEVRYAGLFPKIAINRLVNRVIKSIEATALQRAKAARSQQPAT
jgi:hypothetical protein